MPTKTCLGDLTLVVALQTESGGDVDHSVEEMVGGISAAAVSSRRLRRIGRGVAQPSFCRGVPGTAKRERCMCPSVQLRHIGHFEERFAEAYAELRSLAFNSKKGYQTSPQAGRREVARRMDSWEAVALRPRFVSRGSTLVPTVK